MRRRVHILCSDPHIVGERKQNIGTSSCQCCYYYSYVFHITGAASLSGWQTVDRAEDDYFGAPWSTRLLFLIPTSWRGRKIVSDHILIAQRLECLLYVPSVSGHRLPLSPRFTQGMPLSPWKSSWWSEALLTARPSLCPAGRDPGRWWWARQAKCGRNRWFLKTE